MQNINGLRELGVGLVVVEGEVEGAELWKRVKAQCVDVTKPVAAFVAGASGEPFVGPFSNLPAAFIYVPTRGAMVLVVTSQSCGSAVMASAACAAKRPPRGSQRLDIALRCQPAAQFSPTGKAAGADR